MKMESIRYTGVLTLSILAIWLWSHTASLNIYNLQLTGVFILLYFAFKKFSGLTNHRNLDIVSTVILNSICLLLIFSTGGVISPLFFLLDFLIIALALLVEPRQAAVTSIILAVLFLLESKDSLTTEKVINIVSLLLMAPIAIVFSKTYLENLKNQGLISFLEKAIKEEESESLLWISSQAKPSLATVLNATTDVVMYFNSKGRDLLLPTALLTKLKAIQDDLIILYSSTNTLENVITESADKIKLQQDK